MVKGKVVEEESEEPEEEDEEGEEEDDEEEDKELPEIKPPSAGAIMKYPKELGISVIDEEGNRILCENIAQAKILSLLLEKKKKK